MMILQNRTEPKPKVLKNFVIPCAVLVFQFGVTELEFHEIFCEISIRCGKNCDSVDGGRTNGSFFIR